MGYDICTCLTDRCDYNENLTQKNGMETQISSTKLLYFNTITSNNYSKSNRQKLLNSINNTYNDDTFTNLNQYQYQFNQTDNKTILSNLDTQRTNKDNMLPLPYLDYNTLTKYIENIQFINKISAVYRGHFLRKKYNNVILDKLISFEQKLIYKYNQKVINNNPNLEKFINKFGEKILNYQNL